MPPADDQDTIYKIRAVKWLYHLMALAGVLLFAMWMTATVLYLGTFEVDVGMYSVSVLLTGGGVVGSLLYRELEKEAAAQQR
jgi:hypothetical protein